MTPDFDAAVASSLNPDNAAQPARIGFVSALDTNPDAQAEARRVARSTGVPVDTALAMPVETQRQARIGAIDFDTLAKTSPATAALLADVDKAKLAHDDVEQLGLVERVARQFTGGAVESAGLTSSGLGHLLDIGQRGLARAAGGLLPTPESGGAATVESLAGPLIGEGWRGAGGLVKNAARERIMIPSAQRGFGDDVVAGLGQIAGQIATIAVAPGVGTATLYAQGADQMAEKIAADTATQGDKDLAVLGGAIITGVTEKYALDRVLGPLAVPLKNRLAAAVARVGIGAAAEGGQEFAENLGQDVLRRILTNDQAPIDLPESFYEGGVGAAVGATARAAVEAALHVRVRGVRRQQQAEQSAQDAQALQATLQAAEASRLRERAPDVFEGLLNDATRGADVFVDAQSLANALGQDLRRVAADMPALGAQLEQAAATGAPAQLPLASFATELAGKDYAEAVLEHVKTRPDGMTPAELQGFMETRDAQEAVDLERESAAREEAAQRTEHLDAIERDIASQLDAAGRFTPDVNRAYAALPRAFFDTMAARLGVSPQSLFEQYRPTIVSEPVAEGRETLDQASRGAFAPSTNTIALLKRADLTTALHEMGHYYLESFSEMAKTAAPLRGDMQSLLGWFGVESQDAWNAMSLNERRAHHEQFARGFEAYLMEGRAPAKELQGLFQRFRAWLVAAYRQLSALHVELTDEVRAVMDRMLATDPILDSARQSRDMAPLFATPEEAAQYGVEWPAYQALQGDAAAQASGDLEARSLRDMQWAGRLREATVKRLNADALAKRKALRAEVREEVAAQPIYRAQRWLKRGQMVGADGELIQAEVGHRLSLEALRAMYPQGELVSVPFEQLGYGKYGMLAAEGLHPDLVAEMFGFPSGDTLVRELLSAPRFNDAIETLTDRRMLERYGDITSAAALAQAADEAIHNEVRTRFLATELAALQKSLGGVARIQSAAREIASQMIARVPIGKLRPSLYASADTKAGRAADAALKKGDVQEAARQKRLQIINHVATKLAYEAQAESKKTLGRLKKIAATTGDALTKSRNADIGNAARAILAEYGLGTRGNRPRQYLEAVKTYDANLYGVLEPMILDAEETAKPAQELTVSELQALSDNVESLWYLARREQQAVIDGKLVDRREIVQALASRLDELGVPSRVPGEGHAVTEGEKLGRMLAGARAALRRVEHWVDRMDGGNITGAFRRYLFTPVSEAADAYRIDSGKYLARLRDLVQTVEPSLRAGKIAAPELNYEFGHANGGVGKAELLHALLHTGNESNRRKLLLGRNWASEDQAGNLDTGRWDAFVARMIREGRITKADYDFAQGVWDLLEDTKPLAQKTHREVFGRYFDEVTANEVTTPWGVYRGGYVPAITDTFEVQDAAINAELESVNQGNSFMFPAAARGFTKARVEYSKPLALDLRILPQHIDKVLLFAHMEPKVRDVVRTLKNKELAGQLNRYDPTAYSDMLLPWLNRAARQTVETPATGWGGKLADRFFRTVRARAGMAAMFANVTNAMQQITGLSITALKVRPRHLQSATWRYLRSPKEMADAIAALSPFMAARLDNEAMHMRSHIDALLLNPNAYQQVNAWTQKHAYFLQSAFQNVVDVISWSGAYDQALADGLSQEDAVRTANAAVRETQGSLAPEDISRFESGNSFTRLFTQFASYFNMQANLLGTEFAKTAQETGLRKGAGRLFYVFLMGFLIPAWVSEAIVQAMRGGPGDDDGDGYLDEFLSFFLGAPARSAAAMVPVVGQSATLLANSFNRKPYDDRIQTAPAVSMIESAASAPHSLYAAMAEDGSARRAIRDTLTLVSLVTGMPLAALGKPLGYATDIEQGKVTPAGALDAARGLVSGAASPESKR